MQVKQKYILDEFQTSACDALDNNFNILVSAPTGSGKTAIAEYAIEKGLEFPDAQIIYTCPIKSLSNEKYYDFNKKYDGQVSIGLMTGDIKINDTAQIIIMTTEVLLNLFSSNKLDNVKVIIFDEAHYLNDESRGHVWEKCIIYSLLKLNATLVLLSATIGNIDSVINWLNSIHSEKQFKKILKLDRPVPLKEYFVNKDNKFVSVTEKNYHEVVKHWDWLESKQYSVKNQLNKLIEKVSNQENVSSEDPIIVGIPAIVFVFSKVKCEQFAQHIEHSLVTPDEQTQILNFYKENLKGYENTMQYNNLLKVIKKGVAYHHSGLIPRIREVVEFLMKNKLIKLVFATETFAVGLNFPVKTVVLTSITKPTNNYTRNLLVSEYKQMAGRAGRRFIDKVGNVILWFYPESERNRRNTYPMWSELYNTMYGAMDNITSKYIVEPNYVLKHLDDFIDISDKSYKYYVLKNKKKELEIPEQYKNIIKYIELGKHNNIIVTSFTNRKLYDKEFNKLTQEEKKDFNNVFISKYYDFINKTEYDHFKDELREILKFLEYLELIEPDENNVYKKTKWGNLCDLLTDINPIVFITDMDSILGSTMEDANYILCILSMFIEDGENTKDYTIPEESKEVISYFENRMYTTYNMCMQYPKWNFYPKNYNITYDWLFTELTIDDISEKYQVDCGVIIKIMVKMYQIAEELIKFLPEINRVELVDYITSLKQQIIKPPVTIDSLYLRK